MLRKNFNRVLSLILAALMLAVAMPIAFAATELTKSNIVTYPTVEGEYYYGQRLGDTLTLVGGEVQYEGTKVEGEFQFEDPNYIQVSTGSGARADIKFVPSNTEEFTGFSESRSRKVKYTVLKADLALVDENTPPTATVPKNSTLSEATIVGGQVKNVYNAEMADALAATWTWTSPDTVVTESGYYEANINLTNYNVFTLGIYVEAKTSKVETSISTLPTVPEMTYNGVTTWAAVALEGGLAVEKDTTTAVEGTFTITDSWKRKVIESGSYEIDAVFTPNDSEAYTKAEFQIPVTVNKGTVKFVDESGNEIVPEITIDRILTVGTDLNGYLKPYLNASCSLNYEETEGYGEKIKPGTHEYTVKTIIDDTNYERYGTLTFKIVLNKEKVNAKVKNVAGGKKIYIEGGDIYHLNGDFDVKYFIDGKEAGTIEGVEFNETFEVKQDKSGVYTYEIVYNGTEDDYYDITVITEAEDIKLQHQVKVNGGEPVVYTYGEAVTITAPAHEKPYYVFTGWSGESGITLSDEQRTAEEIKITMPDNDIELEANYKFSFKLFFEWIWAQIVNFFNYVINAVKGLISFA